MGTESERGVWGTKRDIDGSQGALKPRGRVGLVRSGLTRKGRCEEMCAVGLPVLYSIQIRPKPSFAGLLGTPNPDKVRKSGVAGDTCSAGIRGLDGWRLLVSVSAE